MLNKVMLMYSGGMSMPDIAKAMDTSYSKVRNMLVKTGVELRSRADAVRLAVSQGKRGKGNTTPRTEEQKRKTSESRKAWSERNAKGKRISHSGYVEYTTGKHKGRSEHVVAIEHEIGRSLLKGECVHHKDGNKMNNSLSNLQLMTISDHTSLHAKENIKKRKRDSKGRLI